MHSITGNTPSHLSALLRDMLTERVEASKNHAFTRMGDGVGIERHLCSSVPVPPDPQLLCVDSAISLLAVRLNLTPRQAEVMHWIAEGKTNSEIGIILDCSFNTVKTHLKEIFQRLGVHSRTAAAACAYRAHIAGADALRAASALAAKPSPKAKRVRR